MSFFTCVFQGFCLLFSNTYLKKHLWMASSVYLNREASQGCIDVYFLGKHCYQEHLNMKILHSKLFQGEYLFPWGRTYLLVNKYWRSSYFAVNNYRGVLINGYTGNMDGMMRSRFNKNGVKYLQKRSLRLLYIDKTSSYKEEMEREHLASARTLAVQIFKIMVCILLLLLINFFLGDEIIITLGNLRKIFLPSTWTVYYGSENISLFCTDL